MGAKDTQMASNSPADFPRLLNVYSHLTLFDMFNYFEFLSLQRRQLTTRWRSGEVSRVHISKKG